MNNRLIIFALIVTFSFVNAKEFCRAFYDNKFRIDILFRRVFDPKKTMASHNIVIGGEYWTISLTDQTLTIDNEKGRPAPAFMGSPIGAAFLRQDGQEFTLLFKRGLNNVELLTTDHNNRDHISMDFTNSGAKELQKPNDSNINPDIVFANPFISSNTIDMLTRNGTKLLYDSLSVRKNNVNSDSPVFVLEHSPRTSPWNNFDSNNKQVMAISAHKSEDGNGFLVILKENIIIWWCLVNHDGTCNPKELTRCPTMENPSEKESLVWVLLYISLVLVITVIVIIVIYFALLRAGYDDKTEVVVAAVKSTERLH